MNNIQTIFFAISFMFIFPFFNTYAYDHSFTVSGEDETGNSIVGVIYFNNGESSLNGSFTDENGRVHQFSGQWTGSGHVWSYYE
jgi:hypothetical protein